LNNVCEAVEDVINWHAPVAVNETEYIPPPEELDVFNSIQGQEAEPQEHLPSVLIQSSESESSFNQSDRGNRTGYGKNKNLEYEPCPWDPDPPDPLPDESGDGPNEPEIALENFSILDSRLKEIEAEHICVLDEDMDGARETLVAALGHYWISRFQLGEALAVYKKHLAEKKKQSAADCGWMAAVKSIAEALSCDERTIRNILADYERTANLPATVIQAAQVQGIDLAQRRYRPAVAAIESIIENKEDGQDELDLEEAERILSNVLVMPSPKHQELDADAPFIKLTREEKQHFAVRMKIRTALINVEPGQKLSALIAALEEEMFSIWDQKEPVTVTIRPRASAYTLDGRKRREDVA
jgi:hypothetical protein